jgi:hypothetical protein
MRKLILIMIVVAMALVSTATVFGQSKPADVDSIYARTRPIVKILSHNLGYKVYYVTVRGDVGHFYLPIEWFTTAGGKGSITYGTGAKYPYFSMYWVDNSFSHIKLFLVENVMDDSWGVLTAQPSVVADKFGVEEPQIDWSE